MSCRERTKKRSQSAQGNVYQLAYGMPTCHSADIPSEGCRLLYIFCRLLCINSLYLETMQDWCLCMGSSLLLTETLVLPLIVFTVGEAARVWAPCQCGRRRWYSRMVSVAGVTAYRNAPRYDSVLWWQSQELDTHHGSAAAFFRMDVTAVPPRNMHGVGPLTFACGNMPYLVLIILI